MMKKRLFIFPLAFLLFILPCVQVVYGARISGEDKPVSTYDVPPQPPAEQAPAAPQLLSTDQNPSDVSPPPTTPTGSTSADAPRRSSATDPTKVEIMVVPEDGRVQMPAPLAPDLPVPPITPPTVKDDRQQPVKAPIAKETKIKPDAPPELEKVTEAEVKPDMVTGEEKKTVSAAKGSQYITIDFDGVDIQVFIKFIGEMTGKNFVIDERVKGKVTIMSPRKISIDEAYKVFHSVLDVNGFAAVPSGNIIKIIPVQQAKEKNVETLLKNEALAPEDKVVTQIISLTNANSDEIKKVLDPLISKNSVMLSYAPTGMLIITDILSNIQRIQEIVKALDVEGMAEQISFIPAHSASSDALVKSLTAVFQQQKSIKIVGDDRTNAVIVIASAADTERVKKLIALLDKDMPRGEQALRVYRLQNATSDDLAKVLSALPKEGKDGVKGKSPLLSKDVQVVSDKATNTLLVTAGREDYTILEDVIKQLDTPRPMVFIEALIMEVNVNSNFKVGVEWRGIKDTGKMGDYETGSFIGSGGAGEDGAYNILPLFDAATKTFTYPGGFSMGILGAGIKIGDLVLPNIAAVLQAYQTDSNISILSTPQVLTVNNEEAEIHVGKNVPYVTRQEQNTTGVDYSSYEYKDVGVNLKVTPNINETGFVRLKIDQQVTKVITAESKTGLPTTLKRTAKTTVVIKDGETIVIGGLVGDATEQSNYKVPFLGSIPVLGWLFKTMSNGREKTNLYIFLTPHIVRNQQEVKTLSELKRGEMGVVEEGVIKLNDGRNN